MGGETMANIQQQIKRNLTNEKKREANFSYKSMLKTTLKSVKSAVAEKDLAKAEAALSNAYKVLDKALAKKIVHKNYVARNKAELAEAVNSLR